MERITLPQQSELELEINSEDQKLFGPCVCCGEMTSRVWGYVYRSDAAVAAYFVEWTRFHTMPDAMFDLIVGTWGEGKEASDRQAVSVAFRQLETGPSFMVQDSSARNIASSPLISQALDRNAVIGTPLATEVFAICDLIYLADPRLSEIRRD
jgi:hypothetical protein